MSLITHHTDSLLVREILGPAIKSLRRNPDLTCEVYVTQGITLNEPGTISAQISPNAFEVPPTSGLPSRRERAGCHRDDMVKRQSQRPLALGVSLSGFRCDTTRGARTMLNKA